MMATEVSSSTDQSGSTFKIIHKDQEAIHGFCLNEVTFIDFNCFTKIYQLYFF